MKEEQLYHIRYKRIYCSDGILPTVYGLPKVQSWEPF